MKASLKLALATAVILLVGLFVFRNMGHQTQLRLFREVQVSTLLLLGIAFFAGGALVFLFRLWRHWKGDRGVASRGVKRKVMDEDL